MYGELHVSSLQAVDAARINPIKRPPMPRRDEILLLFMMHLPVYVVMADEKVDSQEHARGGKYGEHCLKESPRN